MNVPEALEVLRAAGWTVREDHQIGQLIPGIEPPLVMVASGYHPANRKFTRHVAQQPWTATDPNPVGET